MSKTLEAFQPLILLDKHPKVTIQHLVVEDPELHTLLSYTKKKEWPTVVKRALTMGATALKSIALQQKLDYVETTFKGMTFEVNKILTLNKNEMEGKLDRVFGKNGELELILDKHFGDDGKLMDLLDMDNMKSPIGRLRTQVESFFVGKDSTVYGVLDPYRKDSPAFQLREEIMNGLRSLEDMIKEQLVREEVEKVTPMKGWKFEDVVESFLQRITKPFNDLPERVTEETGKMGKKRGDFIIVINDPSIKENPPRIVVEAKSQRGVAITRKGLLGYLDEAMENREAKFAIAISEVPLPTSVGHYREYEQNKIVCEFGEDGLLFEVAYKVARARVLIEMYGEVEGVNVAKMNAILKQIETDLNSIQGIKTKVSRVQNVSKEISADITDLEDKIRERLSDLQQLLVGSAKAV